MKQIPIEIDACEHQLARAVASWRVDRVIRERLGKGHGEAGRDREKLFNRRHLPGAMAELAYSKHWDVFWSGNSEDFGKVGDIKRIEARGTSYRTGHMIVFGRDTDPDERLVVCGAMSGFQQVWLVGGMVAANARQDQYLPPPEKVRKGSPPQWWVPQRDLIDLALLVYHRAPLLDLRPAAQQAELVL